MRTQSTFRRYFGPLAVGMIVPFVSPAPAAEPSGFYQFENLELETFVPVPGELALSWILVDPATGEELASPEGIVTAITIFAGFDADAPGEPLIQAEVEDVYSFAFEAPEPAEDGPFFYSAELIAFDDDGNPVTEVTSRQLELREEADFESEPTEEFIEMLLELIAETRTEKALLARECEELKEPVGPLREAMEEAHHEMEKERARRREARSRVAEYFHKAQQLNLCIDKLEDELQAAKEDLRDALQAHYDSRSRDGEALPIHLVDEEFDEDGWVVFEAAPGVMMGFYAGTVFNEARLEHFADVQERDLATRFGRTGEYRDLVEKIEDLREAIEEKLDDLEEAEQALHEAQQDAAHQLPVDLDYNEARDNYTDAKNAYEECVEEKTRLCEQIEFLTRMLERSRAHRKLARNFREADGLNDEMRELLRELTDRLEAILDGIPSRRKDDPAINDDLDCAASELAKGQAKKWDAEDLVDEVDEMIADPHTLGDDELEEAADLAEEARKCSEEAREHLDKAREKLDRAAQRLRELQEQEARRLLREKQSEMNQFRRWHEQRAAAMRYLREYHFDGDSEDADRMEGLEEAIKAIIDLADSLEEGMREWLDIPLDGIDGEDGLEGLDGDLSELLEAIGVDSPLEALQEISDFAETIADVRANIRVLLGGAETPEELAQQLASVLSLISTMLDQTAGRSPILQAATGLYGPLLDAISGQLEQLMENLAERQKHYVRTVVPSRARLMLYLMQGKCHDDIKQKILDTRGGITGYLVRKLEQALGEQQFRNILRAAIKEALVEASLGQLREKAPENPYGDWVTETFPQPMGMAVAGSAFHEDPQDPEGNPARDGIPNFAKYYFHLDPLQPEVWPFEQIGLPVEAGGDPVVAFQFPRTRGAVGVIPRLEFTEDLGDSGSWEPVEVIETFFPDAEGDREKVGLYPDPPKDYATLQGRGFYRLLLEWSDSNNDTNQ